MNSDRRREGVEAATGKGEAGNERERERERRGGKEREISRAERARVKRNGKDNRETTLFPLMSSSLLTVDYCGSGPACLIGSIVYQFRRFLRVNLHSGRII